MRITANGITFNCEIEGPEGAPWIMFSNSLATNLSMWDPQAADFKPSFRVLRYDQRGHGATEAPAGGYTYPQLVADAVALLDALKISRTHFVGLSMGGATALALAELHPDRVDRVVVCNSPCMSTPADRPAMGGAHRHGPQRRHGGAGQFHLVALVPAGNARRQAGPCGKSAGDDPVDAGRRLHRRLGRARRS